MSTKEVVQMYLWNPFINEKLHFLNPALPLKMMESPLSGLIYVFGMSAILAEELKPREVKSWRDDCYTAGPPPH